MKYSNSLSYKNKIFLVLIIMFLVINIFSCAAVFGVVMPSMMENGIEYEQQLVLQTNQRVENYLDQVNSLCIQVSYSTMTRSILEKNFNGSVDGLADYVNDRNNVFQSYNDFVRIVTGVDSIIVYNKNGFPYYYTRLTSGLDLNAKKMDWFISATDSGQTDYKQFTGLHIPYEFQGVSTNKISLRRNIRSIDLTNDFKEIGYAEIQINPAIFENLIKGTDNLLQNDSRQMTLVDQTGKVIYSNNESYLPGDVFNKEIFSMVKESDTPLKSQYYNNFLISFQHSNNSGWYLIGQTDKVILSKEIYSTLYLYLISGIVSIILFTLFGFLISREISKPIKILHKKVIEIEKGNFDGFIQLSGNDEFSLLAKSFSEMSLKLKDFIARIYITENQKRDAEIAAMQAQINPHFTLNTLNTIKYMATLQNSPNIVLMLEDFTMLVMAALKHPNELITFKEEFDRIRAFSRIQDISTFGKIQVELEYNDEVLDYTTMGLILQPIVENAVFHGIKPKLESHQRLAGTIKISVEVVEKSIHIHVKDDGVGIKKDDIPKLFTGENNGIAIRNVQQRIKMRYGDEYGLTITSDIDQGCDVFINIPKIKKGDV